MFVVHLQEARAADVGEGWPEVMDGCWPFQRVADQLIVDCLDPSWETRHGAALALREILSCQAASAAVVGPVDDTPSGAPAYLPHYSKLFDLTACEQGVLWNEYRSSAGSIVLVCSLRYGLLLLLQSRSASG